MASDNLPLPKHPARSSPVPMSFERFLPVSGPATEASLQLGLQSPRPNCRPSPGPQNPLQIWTRRYHETTTPTSRRGPRKELREIGSTNAPTPATSLDLTRSRVGRIVVHSLHIGVSRPIKNHAIISFSALISSQLEGSVLGHVLLRRTP